jgi:hypothetical protein
MSSSRTPDSQNESGEELTPTEKLLAAGTEKIVEDRRREALIPFHKLCNSERNRGDTEMIHGVRWKVFRSERRFDNLFRAYCRDLGQKWKEGNPPVSMYRRMDSKSGTIGDGLGWVPWAIPAKRRYPEAECEKISALARDTDAWEKEGEQRLQSWKKDGMPTTDFLALASFCGYFDFENGVKVITGRSVAVRQRLTKFWRSWSA